MGDCAFGGWPVGVSALLGEYCDFATQCGGDATKKKTPRSDLGGV